MRKSFCVCFFGKLGNCLIKVFTILDNVKEFLFVFQNKYLKMHYIFFLGWKTNICVAYTFAPLLHALRWDKNKKNSVQVACSSLVPKVCIGLTTKQSTINKAANWRAVCKYTICWTALPFDVDAIPKNISPHLRVLVSLKLDQFGAQILKLSILEFNRVLKSLYSFDHSRAPIFFMYMK